MTACNVELNIARGDLEATRAEIEAQRQHVQVGWSPPHATNGGLRISDSTRSGGAHTPLVANSQAVNEQRQASELRLQEKIQQLQRLDALVQVGRRAPALTGR